MKELERYMASPHTKRMKVEGEFLSRGKILDDCRILPEDVLFVEARLAGRESLFEGTYVGARRESRLKEELKTEGNGPVAFKSNIIDFSFMKKKIGFAGYSGSNGLKNIGNTCFLNSAMQCMSNTEPLTRYFLTKAFTSHLNQKNKLGTGGALAVAYYRLMEELWLDRGSTAPWDVKKEVARKARQFMGYNQQDSSEFLNFLIDTLH